MDAYSEKPIGEERHQATRHTDMYCPMCGRENPDEQRFCGYCGSMIPAPPQDRRASLSMPESVWDWILPYRKALFAGTVVVLVILATVGLVYTQPLSKVIVTVGNNNPFRVYFAIYLDGEEQGRGSIDPMQSQVFAAWPVVRGTHVVAVDSHFKGVLGAYLDGKMESSDEYFVSSVSTLRVYTDAKALAPELVGRFLDIISDVFMDDVTVYGHVVNDGSVACYGSISYKIWDDRGWNVTDTIQLGVLNPSTSVTIDRVYDWPQMYAGQNNFYNDPTWSYTITYS